MEFRTDRIVCKIKKNYHITPILQKLHWLQVRSRNQFKTLLLTYKSLNGKGPAYISELLTRYFPGHSLQSSDQNLLKIPRSN